MTTLASINYESNLFWAILIAWVFSVVLHEFAHGLVAHLSGDYTIRERGGLSLNPLQYIDPIGSIVIPLVLLAIGGIPLPGGVTYVRLDLIKSRLLQSAVSLAGPVMNLLIAILCLAPLHPVFGWLDPTTPLAEWTNPQIFLAAMGVLMVIAAVFNLLPIPPLDGFGIIAPFLPPAVVAKLRQPQAQLIMLMVLFFLAMRFGISGLAVEYVLIPLLRITGFDPVSFFAFPHAFDFALFGG
jgi:Zn-dependent protease